MQIVKCSQRETLSAEKIVSLEINAMIVVISLPGWNINFRAALKIFLQLLKSHLNPIFRTKFNVNGQWTLF